MATYECSICGMSVNATCGKCNEPLVDDILKTEFDLPKGLADTSKTKVTVNTQTPDKRSSTGYKQTEK